MEELPGMLLGYFNQFTDFAYQYALIINLILVFIMPLYRIAIANVVYVSRNDTVQWVLYGIAEVWAITNIFMTNTLVWFLSCFLLICFVLGSTCLLDKTNQLKTTIRGSNIIFKNEDPAEEKTKEKQIAEARIERSYIKAGTHLVKGVPVFGIQFKFKLSPTADEQQIGKVVQNLSKFYTEYNWRPARKKANQLIIAEIKTNTVKAIDFPQALSNELPWYMVPLGAVDITSKKTINDTPYIWSLHDPKVEGKTFPSLKNVNLPPHSPQCFIAGGTGGGKSVCLNTIIAHFLNCAKNKGRQARLFLGDAKRVEFTPYEGLEEVEGIAYDLESLDKITTEFRRIMKERNTILAEEGMKEPPLDGRVTLRKHTNINGHIVLDTKPLNVKFKNGDIKELLPPDILAQKEEIAEVDFGDNKEEEDQKQDNRESMRNFFN